MRIEVDPSFREGGQRARDRARKRRTVRITAGLTILVGLVLGGLVLGGLILSTLMRDRSPTPPVAETGSGDSFVMVQAEGDRSADSPRRAPVHNPDLQVDPMILRLAAGEGGALKRIVAPAGLPPERIGKTNGAQLVVLDEPLLRAERTVQVALPSSREDFALFQAQRGGLGQASTAPPAASAAVPVESGEVVRVAGDGPWGRVIGQTGTGDAAQAVYVETRIENTTSSAVALPEPSRYPLFEDVIVALERPRPLDQVLAGADLPEDLRAGVVAAVATQPGLSESLPAGGLVALRLRRSVTGRDLLQLSVYDSDGLLGSLARTGINRYAAAADPWFAEDLRTRADIPAVTERTEPRLIDAVFDTGLRAGLPQRLVGELIFVLSQRFDLDRFASEGDRLRVLYAENPGPDGSGVGQFLFAAIEGPSGAMPCYVLPLPDDQGFACFDFENARPFGRGGLGGGLVVPVDGVRTSGFGPRNHPILKQVRNHNGIDWAAPTGTPVRAAMPGRIAFAGEAGGYGNVVRVDHGDGLETRYAHLDRFAAAARQGVEVAAGAVIGHVGTTGRSTGPHLHFELRVDGAPVDPTTWGAGRGGAGSQAVEALVDQIIQVESAGNARAKNPRSSATGLGQFIDSTWLRMIRDYRPDLAQSLTRAAQLELRFDPALSREMTRNLARENESYLRSRGHPITAGHLYLAHFLGSAGAHVALSANRGDSVLSVMGQAVVDANPFLRDMTVADMIAWSDRKMGARGGPRRAAAVIPPEVAAYREAVDAVLGDG